MPRATRFAPPALVERSLPLFWRRGYGATSVDDLTRCTQASRHAIYRAFDDKRALLLACLDAYQREVVSPAFAQVERPGAGLADIAAYFEHQIAAAEAAGLPGQGCLLANLMTEAAPHDPEIAAIVRAHLARLRSGFANALRGEAGGACLDDAAREDWAALLATMAQGLWSTARVARDAAELRRPIAALLKLVEGALAR